MTFSTMRSFSSAPLISSSHTVTVAVMNAWPIASDPSSCSAASASIALLWASVSSRVEASLVITSFRIAAIDLRLANHCRRIFVSNLVASVLSSMIARVDQRYGKASRLSSSRILGCDGRKPDNRQHPQMRIAKHRLQPAGQRLVRQNRIEIDRYLRHANALTLGRDGRMQIGQRFLVIDPSKFGHKALDEPKHAVGTVDESTLHLPSIRVLPAIACLVEKPFRARGVFWRRQVENGQKIVGLVMRPLLLELCATLNVDQG